jgi:hypothetical protein
MIASPRSLDELSLVHGQPLSRHDGVALRMVCRAYARKGSREAA